MTRIIITVFIGSMLIVLGSCKKEFSNQSGAAEPKVSNRTIGDITVPENANQEMLRIYDDIQDPDFEIAIIDNPNYGTFSSTPGYDIILSGKTDPNDDISIELNGTTYSPTNEGQWFMQDISLKNYIGQDVTVAIKSGSTTVVQQTIHVPEAYITPYMGINNTLDIDRTGNDLSWDADPYNVSGKIILFYHLYNQEGKIMDTDAEMLDEANGSFNLDGIIANTDVKKIQYSLISGNTVSANVNGNKILFYINTRDHHEYNIN